MRRDSSHPRTDRLQSATAPVEPLEPRRLLAASITLLVNDGPTFDPAGAVVVGPADNIDFGTMTQGGPGSGVVKTFTIRNDGNQPLVVTRIDGHSQENGGNGVNGYVKEEPDFTSVHLDNPITSPPGQQTFSFRLTFPTDVAVQFNSETTSFVAVYSNDPVRPLRKALLLGKVVRVDSAVSDPRAVGTLTNSFSESGTVKALSLVDGIPSRIVQTQDAAIFFRLPVRSRFTMGLTGSASGDPIHVHTICALLTRDRDDSGTIGKLDLAEHLDPVSAPVVSQDLSPMPAGPTQHAWDLVAGDYILYVTVNDIPSTGPNSPVAIDWDISGKATPLPLPVTKVLGKGRMIPDEDDSPNIIDGTSFGTWVQHPHDLPQLQFTVRNDGQATAPKLLASLTVSGDFELINGLPSGGIAPGGSDQIIVRLRDDRSGPGIKRGRVDIDPTEPGLGNYTFDIGGTVLAAFATLDPGTKILTVTGTSGDDAIFFTVDASHLFVKRNGVSPSGFALDELSGIVVNALAGNDTVSTSAAVRIPQTLNGGAGRDSLLGGKADDVLNGDEDHDFLDGGGGHDTLVGGTGSDTVRYSRRKASEPIRVTLDEVADDGDVAAGERDNIRADVEHVIGGAGDDYIEGNKKINRLRGFGGNDTLVGGAGPDLLDGGDGDDVIYGFYDRVIPNVTDDPNDLRGGPGNDRIFAANGVIDSVSGGEGTDVFEGDEDDLVTLVP